MVDVLKRRGCDVCRKRHIKCDRQSPSCTQCIRAGWTCPGYPSDLSFVNYSQNHPTGRSKPITTRGREIRPAGDVKPDPGSSSSLRHHPQQKHTLTRLAPASRIRLRTPMLIAPASTNVDIIRTHFVWAFEQKALPAKFESLNIDPYLRYIPQHLGQGTALDDTARFLALASSLPPDQRDLSTVSEPNRQLLSAYGASIRGLANAVGDPNKVNTSSTLAATLLLQLYETWCSMTNARRALHADAMARLIQHRGPQGFHNEFDIAIFEAELANMLFTSLRAGTECFLASPEWTKIISDIKKDSRNHGPGRYNQAQMEILSMWTYLPGAVMGFRDFVHASCPEGWAPSAGTSPEDSSCSGTPPSLTTGGNTETSIHSSRPPEQTLPPSAFSTFPHPNPPPESFTPLTTCIQDLLSRLRRWRATHLPIDHQTYLAQNRDQPAGGTSYEMIAEVGSGTMIAICSYILATIMPTTNPEDDETLDRCKQEATEMMKTVAGYYWQNPGHPFFASGGNRISLREAWSRVRGPVNSARRKREADGDLEQGMKPELGGGVSERIGQLIDAVFAS